MRSLVRCAVRVSVLFLALVLDCPAPVAAQNWDIPRYELGFFLNPVQLTGPVAAGDVGTGVHFGYNYNQILSVEAEWSAYQIQPIGTQSGRTSAGFFGPRLGYSTRNLGIYGRLRPGFVHFPAPSDQIPTGAPHSTHFAFDLGIGAVRYFPYHTYCRFDFSRLFVNYGSGSYVDPVTRQTVHLGLQGNLSVAFGFGIHF